MPDGSRYQGVFMIKLFVFVFFSFVIAAATHPEAVSENRHDAGVKGSSVDYGKKKSEALNGEKLAIQFCGFARKNEEKGDYQLALNYYRDALEMLASGGLMETEAVIAVIDGINSIEQKLDREIIFETSVFCKSFCCAYCFAARAASDAKDYQKAAAFLLRAKKYNPGQYKIYNNLGAVYARTGRFDEAFEAYTQGLSVSPDNPDIYYGMACFFSVQKKEKESLKYLGLAVSHGFRDFELIKKEETLSFIRDSEGYRKIMNGR